MNWRFKLIAVGTVRDPRIAGLTAEFLERLGRWGRCEVVEVPDSNVAREGDAILRQLERERDSRIIALSEEGQMVSSEALAGQLGKMDRKAVWIIGGPLGLDARVRDRADRVMSLSPMTFTHEMARLLLAEQLYRAATIFHGGKYHHAGQPAR